MHSLDYQRSEKLSDKMKQLKKVEVAMHVAGTNGNDVEYLKLDRKRAELEIQIECELALGGTRNSGIAEVSIPRNIGTGKY